MCSRSVGFLLVLPLAFASGCIFPHLTLTPGPLSFCPTTAERADLSDGLTLAIYQYSAGLPDDTGPFPFRIRVVTPDSDGVYRAPLEGCWAHAGLLLWMPFADVQRAPVFYAFLADGRHGLLSPMDHTGELSTFWWSAGELRPDTAPRTYYGSRYRVRTSDEQLRYLLTFARSSRATRGTPPFIPPPDGLAILGFIRNHRDLFGDATLALAERTLAADAAPPTPAEREERRAELDTMDRLDP